MEPGHEIERAGQELQRDEPDDFADLLVRVAELAQIGDLLVGDLRRRRQHLLAKGHYRRDLGLRGLCDRVEALDGLLAVDSPPGEGTRVVVEIPLPFAFAADAVQPITATASQPHA